MTRLITLIILGVTMASTAGSAYAQSSGKHVMWVTPFKGAPYAVWHDNATCPNPPWRR
jgi:hypothetical protein